MRDPKRIRKFCNRLANAWEKFPDLRFFQFTALLYPALGESDVFYKEDEDTIRLIEEHVEKMKSLYDKTWKEE